MSTLSNISENPGILTLTVVGGVSTFAGTAWFLFLIWKPRNTAIKNKQTNKNQLQREDVNREEANPSRSRKSKHVSSEQKKLDTIYLSVSIIADKILNDYNTVFKKPKSNIVMVYDEIDDLTVTEKSVIEQKCKVLQCDNIFEMFFGNIRYIPATEYEDYIKYISEKCYHTFVNQLENIWKNNNIDSKEIDKYKQEMTKSFIQEVTDQINNIAVFLKTQLKNNKHKEIDDCVSKHKKKLKSSDDIEKFIIDIYIYLKDLCKFFTTIDTKDVNFQLIKTNMKQNHDKITNYCDKYADENSNFYKRNSYKEKEKEEREKLNSEYDKLLNAIAAYKNGPYMGEYNVEVNKKKLLDAMNACKNDYNNAYDSYKDKLSELKAIKKKLGEQIPVINLNFIKRKYQNIQLNACFSIDILKKNIEEDIICIKDRTDYITLLKLYVTNDTYINKITAEFKPNKTNTYNDSIESLSTLLNIHNYMHKFRNILSTNKIIENTIMDLKIPTYTIDHLRDDIQYAEVVIDQIYVILLFYRTIMEKILKMDAIFELTANEFTERTTNITIDIFISAYVIEHLPLLYMIYHISEKYFEKSKVEPHQYINKSYYEAFINLKGKFPLDLKKNEDEEDEGHIVQTQDEYLTCLILIRKLRFTAHMKTIADNDKVKEILLKLDKTDDNTSYMAKLIKNKLGKKRSFVENEKDLDIQSKTLESLCLFKFIYMVLSCKNLNSILKGSVKLEEEVLEHVSFLKRIAGNIVFNNNAKSKTSYDIGSFISTLHGSIEDCLSKNEIFKTNYEKIQKYESDFINFNDFDKLLDIKSNIHQFETFRYTKELSKDISFAMCLNYYRNKHQCTNFYKLNINEYNFLEKDLQMRLDLFESIRDGLKNIIEKEYERFFKEIDLVAKDKAHAISCSKLVDACILMRAIIDNENLDKKDTDTGKFLVNTKEKINEINKKTVNNIQLLQTKIVENIEKINKPVKNTENNHEENTNYAEQKTFDELFEILFNLEHHLRIQSIYLNGLKAIENIDLDKESNFYNQEKEKKTVDHKAITELSIIEKNIKDILRSDDIEPENLLKMIFFASEFIVNEEKEQPTKYKYQINILKILSIAYTESLAVLELKIKDKSNLVELNKNEYEYTSIARDNLLKIIENILKVDNNKFPIICDNINLKQYMETLFFYYSKNSQQQMAEPMVVLLKKIDNLLVEEEEYFKDYVYFISDEAYKLIMDFHNTSNSVYFMKSIGYELTIFNYIEAISKLDLLFHKMVILCNMANSCSEIEISIKISEYKKKTYKGKKSNLAEGLEILDNADINSSLKKSPDAHLQKDAENIGKYLGYVFANDMTVLFQLSRHISDAETIKSEKECKQKLEKMIKISYFHPHMTDMLKFNILDSFCNIINKLIEFYTDIRNVMSINYLQHNINIAKMLGDINENIIPFIHKFAEQKNNIVENIKKNTENKHYVDPIKIKTYEGYNFLFDFTTKEMDHHYDLMLKNEEKTESDEFERKTIFPDNKKWDIEAIHDLLNAIIKQHNKISCELHRIIIESIQVKHFELYTMCKKFELYFDILSFIIITDIENTKIQHAIFDNNEKVVKPQQYKFSIFVTGDEQTFERKNKKVGEIATTAPAA